MLSRFKNAMPIARKFTSSW